MLQALSIICGAFMVVGGALALSGGAEGHLTRYSGCQVSTSYELLAGAAIIAAAAIVMAPVEWHRKLLPFSLLGAILTLLLFWVAGAFSFFWGLVLPFATQEAEAHPFLFAGCMTWVLLPATVVAFYKTIAAWPGRAKG